VTSTSVRPRAQGACLSRLPGKRARPVLRGDRCSNAAVLPDERWFGLLTDKQIRRGVHKNVQALEKDIRDWIAHWNEDPKPFTWTKSADEIFERLAGYLNRLPKPKA
jgi:hypothetical protein